MIMFIVFLCAFTKEAMARTHDIYPAKIFGTTRTIIESSDLVLTCSTHGRKDQQIMVHVYLCKNGAAVKMSPISNFSITVVMYCVGSLLVLLLILGLSCLIRKQGALHCRRTPNAEVPGPDDRESNHSNMEEESWDDFSSVAGDIPSQHLEAEDLYHEIVDLTRTNITSEVRGQDADNQGLYAEALYSKPSKI
ncbi:hypothetical protein DPEC_G00346100 [Dallia pectoralis]|uniref:Uncharacterized protein n=1 Tax=Dallia pectoralis TaxID=75939 RepID=A0ACC2F3Y2_DALPE|nr:hypothetical protein DPEC_G00346100 [Dallia pectoralis]